MRGKFRGVRNAFEILGIGPRLILSEEEARIAFREAGKRVHPDAGGAGEDFAALKGALETLSSPSKRLRHWLELRGIVVETRGVIGGGLMTLFTEIAQVTQQAEATIRKREQAKSALTKALLENVTQVSRDQVESAISSVAAVMDRICAGFPEIQTNPTIDSSRVEQIVRDLAFLEKWRTGLRAAYSRLL